MVKQDSLARSGLEIYETKDTNIEKTDKNSDEKEGFVLHNGQITQIAYFDGMISNSFEYDYEDINANATVVFPKVNEKRFYKGKKVLLKKGWEAPNTTLKWSDLKNCCMGFIIDQKKSEEQVEIKITGMSKLLEQKKKFNFTNTKRSKILKSIVKEAGLKIKIDTTGLKDEKIDYTNVSSTGDNSSSGSIGNSSISEYAQKVCEGCTTDEEKAKAIHKELTSVRYPSPNYFNHKKCPKKVLKDKVSNCCDRARTGHEMANAVGLENRGVHGPDHVWVQYKINGKWVDSDPSRSRKSLGKVWKNLSVNRKWDFPQC